MKNEKSETKPRSLPETVQAAPLETTAPVGKPLIEFFSIITRWRKFIIRVVGIVTVLTVGAALMAPKWYKATASVFPAEKTDLLSGLDGISSLVKSFSPGKGISALTGQSEIDRYIAILSSERALLAVIDTFNLTSVYDITSYPREKTEKELLSNVEFETGEQDQLEITVYDKDPQRAADMANYFVHILNEINSELHVQNARANREFIEQRYQKNLDDLRSAEDSLKGFQIKHGVIALPEQLQASIKAMGEIYGRMAVKEIELNSLRRTLSESNASVTAAEIEVSSLRQKIRDLNQGTGEAADDMKVFVPFKLAPQLGAEYLRLFREVEIQYKILQFVAPLFEQMKVEERRNTPSVVVLDKALLPERKAKPKVTLYALLAFLISGLLSIGIVFSAEALKKIRAIDPVRWDALLSTAKTDWFGLKWNGNSKR